MSENWIQNQTPLVVVSVVNWNTEARTLDCLQSLHAMAYPNYRIIMVDNASSDDSVARVRATFPHLEVLESAHNCGFADGHALAYRQALAWGASAIWLVNSDALVDVQALTQLVTAWQRDGNAIYGGVPLMRREDGTVLLNFPAKYLEESGTPQPFQRDADITFTEAWKTRASFRVGAVSGSCFFLPLGLIADYGWLDSAWFLYCEEIDYCYRLRTYGVPCYLVPQSHIWHGGGGSHQSRKGVEDCIYYYKTRNEIVLARRYAGRLSSWLIAAKKIARAAQISVKNRARGRLILAGVRDALQSRMGKTLAPEIYIGDELEAKS
ncbi:MAG: glycosyltransferase family 2 protein [Pseudomonadota bacterium]